MPKTIRDVRLWITAEEAKKVFTMSNIAHISPSDVEAVRDMAVLLHHQGRLGLQVTNISVVDAYCRRNPNKDYTAFNDLVAHRRGAVVLSAFVSIGLLCVSFILPAVVVAIFAYMGFKKRSAFLENAVLAFCARDMDMFHACVANRAFSYTVTDTLLESSPDVPTEEVDRLMPILRNLITRYDEKRLYE